MTTGFEQQRSEELPSVTSACKRPLKPTIIMTACPYQNTTSNNLGVEGVVKVLAREKPTQKVF